MMNPRISVRNIASPIAWGPAGPGMAWHHVIPFALLRDVWNRLVDHHVGTAMPEARTAVRQYLTLVDPSLPCVDQLVDRIRAENESQRRAGHHPLRKLDVAEAHQLATAAVWPVWNTIEGPAHRSDDPGNDFIDRHTRGLQPEEAFRMRVVEQLYREFQVFVRSGPTPTAMTLRMFMGAMTTARPALAGAQPIRFRNEMWIQDNGRWRKRRDYDD